LWRVAPPPQVSSAQDAPSFLGTLPVHLTRAAAVIVVVATLSACGGSSTSSSSPAATVQPRATLTTLSFSVSIPKGWRNESTNATETSKFSQNGTVLALFEAGPPSPAQPNVNDITANINIVLAASPVPDDQLAFYLTSVSENGATNVGQPQPFMVDGRAGLYITYERDVSGTPGQSQDMVVNYKGDTYDIFLNTSKFAFPNQLPALRQVLDSWKWRT